MNKRKNSFPKLFLLVPFLLVSVTNAQIRSDRAIVDQFEKKVQEITHLIDGAQTAQECAEISDMIDELEKENMEQKDLLDKALYPDDFKTTLINLRGRLTIRQNDIGVIESQFQRIMDLELQVRELAGLIDSLSQQNDQLLKAAKALTASAAIDAAVTDSLNKVIIKLRQSLQERDKLIFALLDSVFLQYDKDVASMSDVEKQRLYGKLERRNVLTNIKKAIIDNIQFLETTNLTPADYVEITRQQSEFKKQWEAFGPKLAKIYIVDKKRKSETAVVDSLLLTWEQKVHEGTWKSLATLFSDNGFPLMSFASGDEFYIVLTNYINEEIKNTKQEPENVRSKRYNDFEEKIWDSSLKSWLPALVESGKLTEEQRVGIEDKIEEWKSSVTPTSWVIYVIVALVLVILVITLVRFAASRKKEPTNE
ncbi:MAG: hypothetical protein KBG83_07760 [Bacteroidetes bacterium]|nr:hypothetical protein [Bacteroidota bacterium]